MIKISIALKNISTLIAFDIGDNNIGEKAADAIATFLSHNTKLKELNLHNNQFGTVGIIKIAKALNNVSTLTKFNIGDNSVGEEAAEDIAIILSYNNQLTEVYLNNNSFGTAGIIKIANALQNVTTLLVFSIGANNVDGEATDDIVTVLLHNPELRELYFYNNNLEQKI